MSNSEEKKNRELHKYVKKNESAYFEDMHKTKKDDSNNANANRKDK
jgi:hypothetical protein